MIRASYKQNCQKQFNDPKNYYFQKEDFKENIFSLKKINMKSMLLRECEYTNRERGIGFAYTCYCHTLE